MSDGLCGGCLTQLDNANVDWLDLEGDITCDDLMGYLQGEEYCTNFIGNEVRDVKCE